jgi:protease PrsW
MSIDLLFSIGQPLVIILILLAFFKIRFEIKSLNLILKAIALGAVSSVLIIAFDFVAQTLGYDMLKNLKRSGFYSFAIIGFGSELGKFIFLRYYFLKRKSFKGSLDGIIYSIFISLGFALVALPLFTIGVFSRPTGPQFLFSYTIASIAFAVVMGFFTGLGKQRRNRLVDSLTAIGAASFFHGFYYFINLTTDQTIFIFYSIGMLLISLLLVIKSINMKGEDSAPMP